MRRLLGAQPIAAVLCAFAVLAACTVAWAFWPKGGAGSGILTTGTDPLPVVLTKGTVSASGLTPGATSDLVLTLNNPNPFPVRVTRVAARAGNQVTVTGGHGCTAGNAAVSVVAVSGLSIPVAPGEVVVRVPAAVSMGPSAANGCQGAQFAFALTVSVNR